jgi:hypothetical protein
MQQIPADVAGCDVLDTTHALLLQVLLQVSKLAAVVLQGPW